MYELGEKHPCPRCGGLGTISTPDGKHNEICPICGGSGEQGHGDIQHKPNRWVS